MTVYNVRITLVDLVVADSEDDAIAILRAAADRAGLTPYDGRGDHEDAFVSEALVPGTRVLSRLGRAGIDWDPPSVDPLSKHEVKS